MKMQLTTFDFSDFDFLKLVYLKQFQKYFYCNKISNFNSGKLTDVQLIEVTPTSIFTGEYSNDYNNDFKI
jgi:hypothetical protein